MVITESKSPFQNLMETCESVSININHQYIMRRHVDKYYYKDGIITFKG